MRQTGRLVAAFPGWSGSPQEGGVLAFLIADMLYFLNCLVKHDVCSGPGDVKRE